MGNILEIKFDGFIFSRLPAPWALPVFSIVCKTEEWPSSIPEEPVSVVWMQSGCDQLAWCDNADTDNERL